MVYCDHKMRMVESLRRILRAHALEIERYAAFAAAGVALAGAAVIVWYAPVASGAALALALTGVAGVLIAQSVRLESRAHELQLLARREKTLARTVRDGVIAYGSDFRVEAMNHAAEEIFGVSASGIVGAVLTPDQVGEEGRELIVRTLFPSLAPSVARLSEPGAYPQVAEIDFAEHGLKLVVTTDRVVDEDGDLMGFVKVIHDRSREAEIIQSKSDFVTVAAHQLRTPLTAVNWTFETLEKSELTPEDGELVRTGRAAAAKLLKIVNDLLDVAQIEEGRFGYSFADLDLQAIVERVLEGSQVIAKEYGVSLYFERAEGIPPLFVDEEKLAMAIGNLVDNAIKYNVKNGEVIVRVARTENEPYVKISIEDTGVGIPAEDVGKLFTKFYRSSNVVRAETEGSGLGLYIVKNIVERHGGALDVESVVNRGTKVTISLPTEKERVPNREAHTGNAHLPLRGR